MIRLEQIQHFFPAQVQGNPERRKSMVKEYIQLMMLDYLATTPHIKKIALIGGTCLRLVKGVDRFSEDLDFDCKHLSRQEFSDMAEDVLAFLKRSGLRAEARETASSKLKAFRKNIYFPELLFELGLSGYREERFLIKMEGEGQDQGVSYRPTVANIRGCGFFFPFPVPPDEILCAMKLSALLARQKGRDFYDAMFLLALAKPDYAYLTQKQNIGSWPELKEALLEVLKKVDLEKKSQDFKHLTFQKDGNEILLFKEFILSLG
ncbi:MAG: nucleotidyl transferase AbiEii/AbiGii toxin family protein [Prevotellaceae bacterium]|jgi:predicted nucleotidyltransferase component of viral defense system|nr:nucleotidyl transferase AbiEii/AbiGii toxin family protein [Prevotellaceae bacterium]